MAGAKIPAKNMDKFERAFILAYEGHKGQVDKAGEPYIKHLMRVAGSVQEDYMPVAILHDYCEDVQTFHEHDMFHSMEIYFNFLTREEVYALFLLTRTPDMAYTFYLERIANSDSPMAIAVKVADLKDHLRDASHLPESMIDRYLKALSIVDF